MTATKHALLIGIEQYPHLVGKDLAGPRNDIIELGTLLLDRFGFVDDHVVAHFDGRLGRQQVCEAFDELCERVGEGDIVVVAYSGHGSRSLHGGALVEALVPSDSGRPAPDGDGSANLDIADFEIRGWVERLNRKTSHVSLIFDCCHSGSVTRDPFTTGVREVPADGRVGSPASRGPGGAAGGLLPDRRRAVMLAACQAQELAKEYLPSIDGETYAHGVFTYFLCRALKDAPPGATWRSIFETVAPRVSSIYASQHPRIEGPWDTALFGVDSYRPRSYLRVREVTDRQHVVLAGGLAHGVAEGAEWTLHAPGAVHPAADSQLASLVVEKVAPGASLARLQEADGPRPAVGQRAFLHRDRALRPGLAVHVFEEGIQDHDLERLRRRIDRSDLLRAAPTQRQADIALRFLAPRRETRPGDPCPLLGPLERPTWAAIGKDGHLAAGVRADERGAVAGLLADLEKVARYRGLLLIGNPGSRLDGEVGLEIERHAGEAFVPVAAEQARDLPRFAFGEHMELVVRSRHPRPLWISMLCFGCDYSISQLLPDRDHPHFEPGGLRLDAGTTLRLAADYYSRFRRLERGFTLVRPEGFPWAAEPGREVGAVGLVHLRLMVTAKATDFEFLTQERTRDPGVQDHPLLELSRLYACGEGRRDVPPSLDPDMAWTVIESSLLVGEPASGET